VGGAQFETSYTAKIPVQTEICWWGKPYTALLDLKPGDEFEISWVRSRSG